MKYLRKFEKYENKPDVNSVSSEFWKMVRIANWNKVIIGFNDNSISYEERRLFYKQCQGRIYSKYSYDEVINFRKDYDIIYKQLYKYFEDLWLRKDPNFKNGLPVSDDGYTDLISSIIGKGKLFVKNAIRNKKLVIDMANNDDYAENFGYQLNIDKDEYVEIREEFDPLYRDMKKYNL
jgi:hypothetical protein